MSRTANSSTLRRRSPNTITAEKLMPILNCEISQHLQTALEERSKTTGKSISRIVSTALFRNLEMPVHTLFQVSTSGPLVQGICERAVPTNLLLNYDAFGLGTFQNLV